MYVLLTRPTALSDFVLYYMFYVYIFSCLFLGPTYVRPIHVRITYTFYLYFAWLCLYMYVLRIRFTYTPLLTQLVYAPILYVLRIRTTYAFYLYSICTFLPICFTYPPYTYTYYLYVILIHITYTLYLYI